MACRSSTAERIKWAADRLMECRSTSAVVSQVSEREGLSRRQAQRIVGRAHQVLMDDLEVSGVSRPQIVAQIEHGLMEAMAKALASDQPAAVVGAARELQRLLHLTGGAQPLQPDRPRWQRWS